MMPTEYTWIRDDEAPFDIWLQKSEIPAIKSLIAMSNGMEYQMWFSHKKGPEREEELAKYELEHKDAVTIEQVLEFNLGMFGNDPNRTITILDGEKFERYKRIKTNR